MGHWYSAIVLGRVGYTPLGDVYAMSKYPDKEDRADAWYQIERGLPKLPGHASWQSNCECKTWYFGVKLCEDQENFPFGAARILDIESIVCVNFKLEIAAVKKFWPELVRRAEAAGFLAFPRDPEICLVVDYD